MLASMFESFNGLPLHPLVVHAAVVLIPLTCLGTILIAIKRSWRKTLGWWVVGLAFVSVGAALIAKESGEALAKVVGNPAEHASLGDTLPIIAGVMFIATTALVIADRWLDRRESTESSSQPVVVTGLAILAVIVSLGATAQTVRVGDSGAKVVWAGTLGSNKSSADPLPAASPSTTATSGPTTFTMAQVATHSSASNCWTVIKGTVYDLTQWEDQHPGGAARIIALCGTDGTSAFTGQHGGEPRPANELKGFDIGSLAR